VTPGRNEPCTCGSGRKYKYCCGMVSSAPESAGVRDALSAAEISVLVGLIDLDQLQAAEHRTLALLRTHPDAPMLWKILGVARMRQGTDALHALRRTTELMPHDAEAHGNLGAYLCDHQQWAQALTSLRRSLQIQPRNEQTLVDAANAMKALGQDPAVPAGTGDHSAISGGAKQSGKFVPKAQSVRQCGSLLSAGARTHARRC